MLKDRRVLLEQEITKQKAVCGALYLEMIQAGYTASMVYDLNLEKLSKMLTEFMIISEMIEAGHQ
jgi:hypothetical protein